MHAASCEPSVLGSSPLGAPASGSSDIPASSLPLPPIALASLGLLLLPPLPPPVLVLPELPPAAASFSESLPALPTWLRQSQGVSLPSSPQLCMPGLSSEQVQLSCAPIAASLSQRVFASSSPQPVAISSAAHSHGDHHPILIELPTIP